MRCAIYCRLSREDHGKAESESIQNQKSLLLKYASDMGWDVFDVYCDEDYSGIDVKRPDFTRLIGDARERKFEIVLCKTQSRFTRDMEQVEKYIHTLFPIWGIRFIALADNADTNVKGNKKARQITGLVNEWYLEDLSENIKTVLDHKRRQGIYIGSFPLYGYRRGEEHGRLEIDPPAAMVVRRIFAMYLSGMGKGSICKILNNESVPNPASYKFLNGSRFRPSVGSEFSPKWSKTTVSRILVNEMYAGTMVQGRRRKISYKSDYIMETPESEWFRVENTHEPVISHETFEKAREMIVKRQGKGNISTKDEQKQREIYADGFGYRWDADNIRPESDGKEPRSH